MRLSSETLQSARSATRFRYDRDNQQIGIVHFGLGAFHRAHQAWYTDRLLDLGERDWLISGISMRSAAVPAQLTPQDGLYTVAERSTAGLPLRIIGAVREILLNRNHAGAIVDRLANPATRMASFTITEKGYCRAPDGSLDTAIAATGSVYAILSEGLAARRKAGLPGLTLMSCDNLANNGRQLERLLAEYCTIHDRDLGKWIQDHCSFPNTMVDRIVPASTIEDRTEVALSLNLRDEGAVITEPFSQWVIEDRFIGDRPGWNTVGAVFVDNVEPYETAKLRMLNGAHSLIAYLGLQRGYSYVHEAMADPELRQIVNRLIRAEAAPTIAVAPGQDLDSYAEALLQRFDNAALKHRLIQIAADGSQKISQRWLATLCWHDVRGTSCPSILAGLKAWIAHLSGENGPVEDPEAKTLTGIAASSDRYAVARALFGSAGYFAQYWVADERTLAFLGSAD